MAWPPQFLDELIDRTDLVDLVGESVRLTKKGNSYWGCCPFHSEKTPSFHVVPDRKIYKCFGCGKGGGAINFVMELDNLSFREAVEVLAKRCGMETGRTHQIRVHLAYIGHPILGDTVYGNRKPVPGLTGQCLHATGLRFLHPRTGRPVELTCPRPEEFERMLVKLQKRI